MVKVDDLISSMLENIIPITLLLVYQFYYVIKRMSTIVNIDGHRYDVTAFIPNHPGEKENHSITKYNGQDITELFKRKHNKPKRQEAFQLLADARKNGECQGIKYLDSQNLTGEILTLTLSSAQPSGVIPLKDE